VTTSVSTADNPELANALLQQALGQAGVAQQVTEPPPTIQDQPDTLVTLPAGLLTLDGDVITEAEVRELNGADEEAIAKATTLAKTMDVILQRGVVRVGDKPATADLLGGMLAGDLDALLLAIRIATFGPEFEYSKVTCPHCEFAEPLTLDLRKDVPSKDLGAGDRLFDVTTKRGRVLTMQLPDGDTSKALSSATDRTYASLNTLLLSKCIQEIDGMPVFGVAAIRNLGISDRDDAIEALGARNPGPRLTEVSRSCNECSKDIPLPLTLADLFRL
jgi:hypothetical protein